MLTRKALMIESFKKKSLLTLFSNNSRRGYDLSAFASAHELMLKTLENASDCSKHIDNAVSKTINLPNDYPVEVWTTTSKVWSQVKGTTVYRSGSRGNEPLVPLSVDEAIVTFKTKEF